MRGKRERGWEEKNERRERKTGGQTRGNWGGRSDIKNSPALPKPKGKASQEDQGHNHCQDDPARGAVLICGRGAHESVFSTPPTVLPHFHAFPLLFKCLPQQSPSYPISSLIPP